MHLASNQVEDALNELIHHIRTVNKQRAQASVHDGAVDTILDATDRLFSSSGDAGEMVRQAKILATVNIFHCFRFTGHKSVLTAYLYQCESTKFFL